MQSAWLLVGLVCPGTSSVERPPILSADELIPLQIDVNIGLLGFNADGAWQLEINAGELHGLLSTLLPERRPSCGPEGVSLDVVYRLNYNVVMMQTGVPRLHQRLAQARVMKECLTSSQRCALPILGTVGERA